MRRDRHLSRRHPVTRPKNVSFYLLERDKILGHAHFWIMCEAACHVKKCVALLGAHSFPTTAADKIENNVSKIYLKKQASYRKACIVRTTLPTGSFLRVLKNVCRPHTPTQTTFDQEIPINQGLVTSEEPVLCFFSVHSFLACVSLILSAEYSIERESIRRWKPAFQ